MTVDIWTPADSALIQAVGPYAVPHPYSAGSLRVIVFSDAHPSVTLDPADYIVSPASSDTGGAVWLTDEAFAIYQGRSLQVQRETEAQQGWQGLVGPREKGLERQLDLLTMILQELSEPARNALRTFTRMQPFAAVPGGYVRFDEDGQPQSSGPLPDMDALSDTILGQMTEYAYTFSGDGTATPHPLPMALDDVRKAFVAVHGQVMRPGKDYRLSDDGRSLIPLGTDGGALNVWPWGDENIAVWIRRQLDLAAITSDDVTHDGELLATVIDRIQDQIDPASVFWLSDYLDPADYAAALIGNTAAQNETRVTAAVREWLDEGMAWWNASAGRQVNWNGIPGTIAVNDEMFSDSFAQTLWEMAGGRDTNKAFFHGDMTIQCKGWPARARVRNVGLQAARGQTYPVPTAVFRWEQDGARSFSPIWTGNWKFIGENNQATDPILVKIKAANVAKLDGITVRGTRNIGLFCEAAFNSDMGQLQVERCGFQPTEYGMGTGLIPNAVRFQNVGAVVSATDTVSGLPASVFDASHAGRVFMLNGAGPASTQRRQAHSSVIASVDSPSQITLADVPDHNLLNPRSGSFEAVACSTVAGSPIITLTRGDIPSLVGRYVTIGGCGQLDAPEAEVGVITAVVIDHAGDQVTLSHAVKETVALAPLLVAPGQFYGRAAENHVVRNRTDDTTAHNVRAISGTAFDQQAPLAVISYSSSVVFSAGSKFHGTPGNQNNFGGNFCAILFDYVSGIDMPNGIIAHSGYDSRFGKLGFVGGWVDVGMKFDEVVYPDTNKSATIWLSPYATQRMMDLFISNSRNDGRVGDAVSVRYGPHGNSDMISDYFSARPLKRGLPSGNDNDEETDVPVGSSSPIAKSDFPRKLYDLRVIGDTFATGYGSTLANSASRIAAGFWTPQDGAVYSIGGGLFEGAPGDTSVPDLPGLKGFGPFVTPEMYGAKGDGLANDTAALKAALRTKKTVLCRPRATYLVDDLDLQDNEHLDLNDAELRPYSSACRWLVQMRGTNTILQNGLLNDVDYVTSKTAVVTAGAAAGGTVITVDDIGEITENMFLFSRSSNLHEWTQRRIQTVSGNTITLAGAAQADIPVGATVYAGFGLVSIYHNQSDNFLNLRNLRIRRGHVGIYAKAYGGVSLGNIRTDSCQIYGQLIAGEAILGQVNNWDRISTWVSGSTENTQTATFSATAGQTTIDIGSLGFLIPAQQLYHENEISIRVNGAAKLTFKNSGSPGAGEFTMSQSGLIATVQPLTAGDSVQVSLFRCAITGLFVDPSGRDAGIVSGAHRFLRTSYNSLYDGAYFDSATETVGLLHINMGVFDACRRRSMTAIHVSNFFATHLFLGYSPKPLNIRLKSGDRRMKFVGLHTERDSSGHFDQAYATSGYEVEVLCDAPADALDSNGERKVHIDPWWGPEFSLNDPDNAVAIGGLFNSTGTYTVTIKDTAGNTSPTTVTGRWRMLDANEVQVDFEGLSGIDATGLTSGNVARIGLPFTAAETKIGQIALTSMPSVTVTGTTTYASFMPRVTAGDNFCTVRSFAPMGNQTGQTVANLTGANINNFSIRYRITR